MNAIHIYHLLKLSNARSSESSYHMPGGRTFRNQFVNLKDGQQFGPFTSSDELIITCLSGKMRIEIIDDNLFSIWKTSGMEKDQKSAVLMELEQAILEANCKVKIVAEAAGTVQLIGIIGL